MTDQFDLEQGIMECWNVTSDLNVLLEELMENKDFTTDQASNFVLGLSTIYDAKFSKLFRTFEDFLKDYYKKDRERQDALNEVDHLREEMELAEEANLEAANALALEHEGKSLEELFLEEEQESFQRMMDENDTLALIEDEEAPV